MSRSSSYDPQTSARNQISLVEEKNGQKMEAHTRDNHLRRYSVLQTSGDGYQIDKVHYRAPSLSLDLVVGIYCSFFWGIFVFTL